MMTSDKKERLEAEEGFSLKADMRRRFERGFYKGKMRQVVFDYLSSIVGNLKDMRVLDYACGDGKLGLSLADGGAGIVIGVDLSAHRLDGAARKAAAMGLNGRMAFFRMDSEVLAFKDGSFDLVVGSGILHHLDTESAAAEISRVLKDGGKAAFMEAMGHNLLVNLYRRLTPWARTQDEHPLVMDDIRVMEGYLGKVCVKGFHLFTLFPMFLRALTRSDGIFDRIFGPFYRLDQWLFKRFLFLERNCWICVIAAQKERQDSDGIK